MKAPRSGFVLVVFLTLLLLAAVAPRCGALDSHNYEDENSDDVAQPKVGTSRACLDLFATSQCQVRSCLQFC